MINIQSILHGRGQEVTQVHRYCHDVLAGRVSNDRHDGILSDGFLRGLESEQSFQRGDIHLQFGLQYDGFPIGSKLK